MNFANDYTNFTTVVWAVLYTAKTCGLNSDINLFESVTDFSTSANWFSTALILTARPCKVVELPFTVAKIIAMLFFNDFIDNSSTDMPAKTFEMLTAKLLLLLSFFRHS